MHMAILKNCTAPHGGTTQRLVTTDKKRDEESIFCTDTPYGGTQDIASREEYLFNKMPYKCSSIAP